MFHKKIKISNTTFIGDDYPCFIIGEIGSNHNRSKSTTKLLIDACADANFDAVKFQIYDPELAFSKNLLTKDVNLSGLYGANTPWWTVARDKILMPRSWFKEMYAYAKKKKLIVFTTIHLLEDYYFLKDIGGVQLIKIASIDLEHKYLINQLSRLKIPTLLSTGMATIDEIIDTVKIFKKNKNLNLAILHCVSQYPPQDEDINLNNIKMLKDKFGGVVGYSDHSADNLSATLSIFKGAKIVEKHITLNKNYPGPDHPFAIEPKEMIDLVKNIRRSEKMMGNYHRVISDGDSKAKKIIRRSIVLKEDIKKGEQITLKNVKFARPPSGISPNEFDKYKKKRIKKNLKSETVLQPSDFF